jgi:hypothetical protein
MLKQFGIISFGFSIYKINKKQSWLSISVLTMMATRKHGNLTTGGGSEILTNLELCDESSVCDELQVVSFWLYLLKL